MEPRTRRKLMVFARYAHWAAICVVVALAVYVLLVLTLAL